jgi:hypothetical protein
MDQMTSASITITLPELNGDPPAAFLAHGEMPLVAALKEHRGKRLRIQITGPADPTLGSIRVIDQSPHLRRAASRAELTPSPKA